MTSGSPYDGGVYLVHGPATSGGNLITVADGSYGLEHQRILRHEPFIIRRCRWRRHGGRHDPLRQRGRGSVHGQWRGHLVYEASTGHVELGAAARARVRGANDYEYLGNPIGVPDIDGYGYDEMLIGTGSSDVAGLNTGRAAVFLGGSW